MTKYYRLVEDETPPPNSGQIRTAALLCCGLCGSMIDSMGGPGSGVICERCGPYLKVGALRGCVTWEDDSE